MQALCLEAFGGSLLLLLQPSITDSQHSQEWGCLECSAVGTQALGWEQEIPSY